MNPYTWMTISQFFIQDEFLKRQIGYNTKVALQAKKNAGVVLGHPKSEVDPEIVQTIKDLFGKVSVSEIQRKVGISRRIVDRVIREECK
jgi:DNA invertase Pin-like site-specific DNA recombinase